MASLVPIREGRTHNDPLYPNPVPFTVSDMDDIASTGNNAILIENCYNVNIAANGGTISGGGEVRLAERTEFAGNSDITLRNFTLVNNRIVENPCADRLTISNVTLSNSTVVRC